MQVYVVLDESVNDSGSFSDVNVFKDEELAKTFLNHLIKSVMDTIKDDAYCFTDTEVDPEGKKYCYDMRDGYFCYWKVGAFNEESETLSLITRYVIEG